MKRKAILITSVVLSLCLFAGAVIVPLLSAKKGVTASDGARNGGVSQAQSYQQIYDLLSKIYTANGVFTYGEDAKAVNDGIEMESIDMSADNAVTTPTAASASGAGDYSTTNTQVQGVDEGDIIKTDGRYIYMLRSGKLGIVDAQSMTELCCVKVEGGDYSFAQEMFLSGDTLCIMATYQPQVLYYSRNCDLEYDGSCDTRTLLMFYDVTDRTAPKCVSTLTQSGGYNSARLIGDILYTVSGSYVRGFYTFANVEKPETFIPTVGCFDAEKPVSCCDISVIDDFSDAAYTVVTSVRMSDAAQYDSVKSSFGGYGTVYANEKDLIVACNKYNNDEQETVIDGKNAVVQSSIYETQLLRFSLNDGRITMEADGSIPGTLINQFAIDGYDDYFRFVTTENNFTTTIYTDGIDSYDYSDSFSSGLYVLNKKLEIVGRIVGLADDERVQSVRFMGDTAYFVTFKNVDPLFSVDLSNPTAPKILSQLKIPGFSTYLHPFGEGKMFGLGFAADEEGRTEGLKLSMFDISDASNVTEIKTLKLEEGWSEATYNHKAILISVDRNIIAFPAANGYDIYGYDESTGFFKKHGLDIENWLAYDCRGLFIGERFYVCSGEAIYCFDMEDYESLGKTELHFYDESSVE